MNANRAKAMGAKGIVTAICLMQMLLFIGSAATAASAGVRPADALVDTTDKFSDKGNHLLGKDWHDSHELPIGTQSGRPLHPDAD